MKKGIFISFEGIDGSGKTTQSQRITEYLKNFGKTALYIKEPGATKIGEEIRKILLNANYEHMNFLTELLLYYADRCQTKQEIFKELAPFYDFIISDRSFLSTYAYQGYGRMIDLEIIKSLNNITKLDEHIDLIIYLDIEPKTSLKRLYKNEQDKRNLDRFELNGIDFFKRVRKGYLDIGKKYGDKFIIIDANQPINFVYEDVVKVILDRFIMPS